MDSYILHSPFRTIEHTLEAWRALMALQDEGKVRMIGVSNTYDVNILHALSRERKVQIVQNRWYEGNGWDKQVLNYCREHEIQYQCVFHFPATLVTLLTTIIIITRSFWTLSGSPELLSYPSLIAIARASNCTSAQALFRFAQLEGVTPLSGTTDEVHMRQDLAAENIQFTPVSDSHLDVIKQYILG